MVVATFCVVLPPLMTASSSTEDPVIWLLELVFSEPELLTLLPLAGVLLLLLAGGVGEEAVATGVGAGVAWVVGVGAGVALALGLEVREGVTGAWAAGALGGLGLAATTPAAFTLAGGGGAGPALSSRLRRVPSASAPARASGKTSRQSNNRAEHRGEGAIMMAAPEVCSQVRLSGPGEPHTTD